jgi:ATP-binding cassette subfamily G (WHITE) protein 2 (PDR)
MNRVIAAPAALPGFWIFMYRVSPLTYLMGAILSVGVADTAVTCSALEVLTFDPPPGQTCGAYMSPYTQMAGGEVYNPTATQGCMFCPVVNTNVFLSGYEVQLGDAWRNFGLMWVYIAFNTLAALALFWILRVPKTWEGKGNSISGLLGKVFGK